MVMYPKIPNKIVRSKLSISRNVITEKIVKPYIANREAMKLNPFPHWFFIICPSPGTKRESIRGIYFLLFICTFIGGFSSSFPSSFVLHFLKKNIC